MYRSVLWFGEFIGAFDISSCRYEVAAVLKDPFHFEDVGSSSDHSPVIDLSKVIDFLCLQLFHIVWRRDSTRSV